MRQERWKLLMIWLGHSLVKFFNCTLLSIVINCIMFISIIVRLTLFFILSYEISGVLINCLKESHN